MPGPGQEGVPGSRAGVELLHNPMHARPGDRKDGAGRNAADAAPQVTVHVDETLEAGGPAFPASAPSTPSPAETAMPGTELLERHRPSARTVSLRKTFALHLHHTALGHMWDVFQMLLSLGACMIYVMGTYGYRASPVRVSPFPRQRPLRAAGFAAGRRHAFTTPSP